MVVVVVVVVVVLVAVAAVSGAVLLHSLIALNLVQDFDLEER